MEYDLVIRGGRVVDGSGLPAYFADIGVKHGKIVEIGRIPRSASKKTVDAGGLAVSPGFIDHHTHLDAPPARSGGNPRGELPPPLGYRKSR